MRKLFYLCCLPIMFFGCSSKQGIQPSTFKQQQQAIKRIENQLGSIQQEISLIKSNLDISALGDQISQINRQIEEDQQATAQQLKRLLELNSSPPTGLVSPPSPVETTKPIPEPDLLLPSTETLTGSNEQLIQAWQNALDQWSDPNVASVFYADSKGTHCDLLARNMFARCGLTTFRNRNIDQLHSYMSRNWKLIAAEEAAAKASQGIPTIAMTTKSQPPGSHIVILLGGLDSKGRPKVRGAGTFSGPSGIEHRKRPKFKYRGGTYEGLGWHWRSSHFQYISYFAMSEPEMTQASQKLTENQMFAMARSRSAGANIIDDGFDEDEVEQLGLDGFIDDGNVDDQDD